MVEIKNFLSHLNISKISEDEAALCEKDLTKRGLCNSVTSMFNDKSPGKGDLTK